MSNLNNLQDFLEKQRRRLSPQERAEEAASQERNKGEDIADMAAKNVKAMAADREAARIASGREGMAQAMKDKLKEDEVLPPTTEDTGEVAMMKEGGGGGGGAGGAGGAGGLAGGGTVAVASDPGVFTSTYGSNAKRRLGMEPAKKKKKKKKKKDKDKYHTSGVTKLDRFLRGEKVNQARKSVSVQEFAEWLVDDARTSLMKDQKPSTRDTTYGTGVNEPPTNETHRGKVRNPWGSKGRFKALKGQQGYTDIKHFVKMKNVANTLESQGTVLDLMKALDMDIPVVVN